MSILLEAVPFLLLGSVIASAIGLFVSDNLLYRLVPKNRFAGLAVASCLGIIFPVCDCTVIPIMRRLIRKGLQPSLAVTFMCAVPIVNPAVIVSTAWAFTGQPRVLWLRIIVGISTAITAGFIVGKITKDVNPLRDGSVTPTAHPDCTCGSHGYVHAPAHKRHWLNKTAYGTSEFLSHTTNEFFDSASPMVVGAFLSALVQIAIPRTIMYPVSTSPAASVGVMMGFTWLISLCSNADAFVAKSFYGLFTIGSVVAFMTFGQMIDLKNTFVLLGFFKKRFVIITITVITILHFLWGVGINFVGRYW